MPPLRRATTLQAEPARPQTRRRHDPPPPHARALVAGRKGVPTRPGQAAHLAGTGIGAVTTGRSADPLATAAAYQPPTDTAGHMYDGLERAPLNPDEDLSGPGSDTGIMPGTKPSI